MDVLCEGDEHVVEAVLSGAGVMEQAQSDIVEPVLVLVVDLVQGVAIALTKSLQQALFQLSSCHQHLSKAGI